MSHSYEKSRFLKGYIRLHMGQGKILGKKGLIKFRFQGQGQVKSKCFQDMK